MESTRDKEVSIRRNSAGIVTLRKQIASSEKHLLVLLKRFKEKKISEEKYLEIIRSNDKKWISKLSLNEIKNLLFVIAEVFPTSITNQNFCKLKKSNKDFQKKLNGLRKRISLSLHHMQHLPSLKFQLESLKAKVKGQEYLAAKANEFRETVKRV